MTPGRATDWKERARRLDHKPNPVDVIPDQLKGLGRVFFPIPRGKKGYNYPHHLNEYRYEADSETLNAYLEQGWGYGVACDGDLAVIDVDEEQFIDDITEELPDTIHQRTGSREGWHLFYLVHGLENRITLHYKDEEHSCDKEEHSCEYNEEGECIKDYEWEHLGEVKCDPHGYVVGPGSVHPSGNEYGPLKGDKIAAISEEKLRSALSGFIKPERTATTSQPTTTAVGEDDMENAHAFYKLTADDVTPGLPPGERVPHPVHGSETGKNFQKNEDTDTFICWRHQYGSSDGCGLNPQQLLAVEATNRACDEVRRWWHKDSSLHFEAWKLAVKKGLVSRLAVPYRAVHGYAIQNGLVTKDEKLAGETYHVVMEALQYDMVRVVNGCPHEEQGDSS